MRQEGFSGQADTVLGLGPIFFASLLLFSLPMVSQASALCTPENTVLYVAAHADDSLLFQSPDLLHDIQSGDCVESVYLTAGDAGQGPIYWLNREEGVKSAFSQMANVNDSWTQSDAGINAHPVTRFTLAANPKLTLLFLRLPDGGMDGSGFDGKGSLQQLWEGSLSSLSSLDGSSSYTRQGLVDSLSSVMTSSQPSRINTQDFMGVFGDGDHSDHHATAFFTKTAHALYPTLHTVYSYLGYHSALRPENISIDSFQMKSEAFFAYAPFDSDVCQTLGSCAGQYADWLHRQYTNGSESGGDVCTNIKGIQTEVPSGYVKNAAGDCVIVPSTYAITVHAGENGSISPSVDGGLVKVISGADQTFTITPNTGFYTQKMHVDGVSEATSSTYTFSTVSANHTIDASFALVPVVTTHKIVATAGNGGVITATDASSTAEGLVVVTDGKDQNFTITPYTGFHIAEVAVDGVSVGTTTTYRFYVNAADHTISASFAVNPPPPPIVHTITASTTDLNGSVSPSGTVEVIEGSEQTFVINAISGYAIADVIVDGVSVGATTTYTFLANVASHSINASFILKPQATPVSGGGGGGGGGGGVV